VPSAPRTLLASSAWGPLPGARQEAQSIQRLLPQARLFLGPEATKERLLHLPTPGILHLATHGFFLDGSPTLAGARAVGHVSALADPHPTPSPQAPLLRSGLALASEPRHDVALVTALELAGLNLWGTQLVVLSACDTGRGDVQPGQGVHGLRRSLVVAGAETVVMSLWKVNDDSTRLLMDAYYRNLLVGQGRASALSEAMRSLRASRPHPHDWAPFIALGSNAPLRAILPTPGSMPRAHAGNVTGDDRKRQERKARMKLYLRTGGGPKMIREAIPKGIPAVLHPLLEWRDTRHARHRRQTV
jgi:CHAT domain-containing protein